MCMQHTYVYIQYILPPHPPPRSYKTIFDMIITWSASSLIKSTINHLPCSFNRWTHLHAPECCSPPWASTVCRKNATLQLGNIAPIEDRVYNERMWRCTHGVSFHCILNHCSPTLTRSLNCQGADIFLPDIWIFSPTPLILVQHNAEWGTGRGAMRSGGAVVWCVLTLSKVKYPSSFDVLP